MEEFKDKLLSAVYFDSEKGVKALEGMLGASLRLVSSINPTVSTTATTLLKSLQGAAKDSFIRKIDNTVVILDDLERTNCPELQKNIMGECLNLTLEENKNIGFVFPINMSEVKLEKRQIEKYISLSYTIEHEDESYFDYAFKEYPSLSEFKGMIVNCISNHTINNIRVMKRIASKLNQTTLLIRDMKNYDDIDVCTLLSGLFKEAFIIADNHFNKGLGAKEIKFKCNSRNGTMDDYIPGLERVPEGYIDFMCNVKLKPSLLDIGYIPMKSHGFDDFLFKKPYQFYETFDNTLKSLEEFLLTKEKSKSIIIWFKLLDTYMELVKGSYIVNNIGINNNEEIIALIEQQEFNWDYLGNPNRLRIKDNFLDEKYKEIKDTFDKQRIINHQLNLFEQAKTSWIDVDREIFNNYEKKPLFVGENINIFIELLNGWDAKNTGDFTDFVKARYNEQMRRESKEEMDAIKSIINHLMSLQKIDKKPSLTYGTRQELISTMENAVEIIKRDLNRSDS